MQITKTAHAQLTEKLAPIDAIDGGNALELGFIKQAADMGLNQAQFEAAYRYAVAAYEAAGAAR